MIYESKVEDVQLYGYVDAGVDGHSEKRGHKEHLVEDHLEGTHGYHRVRGGAVVAVVVLVYGLVQPGSVEETVGVVSGGFEPQEEPDEGQEVVGMGIVTDDKVHGGVVSIEDPAAQKTRHRAGQRHVERSHYNLVPLVGSREEPVGLALPGLGVSPLQGVVVELDGSAQQLVDQLGRCHTHSHVEQEVREAVLIGQLEVVREEGLQVWAWHGGKGGGEVLGWIVFGCEDFIR